MIIVHEGIYITSLTIAIISLFLYMRTSKASIRLYDDNIKLKLENAKLYAETLKPKLDTSKFSPCHCYKDLPPWVKLDHKLINHGFVITWDRSVEPKHHSKFDQYSLYDPEGRLIYENQDLNYCKTMAESAIKDRLEFL